jgi:uncharacterized membrane protein YcjF (UPF0283 family)
MAKAIDGIANIVGTVVGYTPAIRLLELVPDHTEFSGKEALYTATLATVMNRAMQGSLPRRSARRAQCRQR